MGHPVGYRRHPMTSPIPGKAYEVFLAAILIMAQYLRTVRRTVLSEGRAAARVAFPGLGKVVAEPPDEVVAPPRVRNMSHLTFHAREARSARKKVQWTVFSQGRAAAPDGGGGAAG